ncbi:TetR/AcrR family transcriptional regulator [Paenibacillus hamazuiensis]|uniref:TetR/AcrR family transcriptional regulator n=1 Tax=Paenibacillus hamazuiensis TaxID=2936508 RepID=UPI00200FD2A1|nr:TetR/AcrR family transcriptional regulator [Paenibacillus hamazuiensis]
MRRESRKRDTKEKIVRHAIRLFKEKGYDNVTVDEITQICGIAKGTFFNYFPKKENVLLHLVDSYGELMKEIVLKHREERLQDRLMNIFRELLHIYLRHADLLRLTLIETIKSAMEPGGSSTNLFVFQETLREMLEGAKADGLIRSGTDSGVSASVLAAIFYHTLINWSGAADEETMAAILQQHLNAVWEGMAGE